MPHGAGATLCHLHLDTPLPGTIFFLRCCAFIIFSLMLNFSIQSKLSVSVRLDGKKC